MYLRSGRTPSEVKKLFELRYASEKIILTDSIQKRPFQGWRYFKQEEVPNDRELYSEDKIEIPLELQKELSEIGIF